MCLPVNADGRIAQFGSRAATAEWRIIDAKGNLFAHGSTTCMILPLRTGLNEDVM
jgi:acyl-coenzyme A thioesterase PaaI-like protein